MRVNSLGAKLRGSDLALAQITARWKNLLPLLEEFSDECEEVSQFTIDTGLLVRAMVVFATGQCRFKAVNNIPLRELQEAWERAKEGIRFSLDFLRANAGIEDESLLSSPFLILLPAYYGHMHRERLGEGDEQELLRWLLIAHARGHYSRGSYFAQWKIMTASGCLQLLKHLRHILLTGPAESPSAGDSFPGETMLFT